MRCLQCGKKLSLLRKIANGEFCSAEHRDLYQDGESQLALARLKESRVRIERPLVIAAVERLRAMDASDSDPEFVETFPLAESVQPINQHRKSEPAIVPEAATWDVALPDRADRRESLSFPAAGLRYGVVESGPLPRRSVTRALALRPLFRVGVRLLGSGVAQRISQMRHAEMSSLTLPPPIPVAGSMRGVGNEAAEWLLPSQAVPSLPAPGAASGADQHGVSNPGDPRQHTPLLEVDRILPLPVRIERPPMPLAAGAYSLPPIRSLRQDSPVRMATRAAKLLAIGLFADPAPRPAPEPARMQHVEPVALRMAGCAPAPPRTAAEALESAFSESLPVFGTTATAERHPRVCTEQEAVALRSAGTVTAIASIPSKPVTVGSEELLPARRHTPAARLIPDQAMQPVGLRAAAGIVPAMRNIAANAALELIESMESMDTALPHLGATRKDEASPRPGARQLAVNVPTAEAGTLIQRAVDITAVWGLGPALPAYDAIHTTLPRMREEAGMQPLALPSTAPSVGTHAATRPRAMAAAAAAGSPALPDFSGHPDATADHPPLAAIAVAASSARPELAEPPGEPVPPALDRQLPLAMGRALNDSTQPHKSMAENQSPVWEDSASTPPAEPPARLTIDHADGSGSRQSRAAAARSRRNLIPTIDMRSLPGRKFWKYAPADLKWVALGLPLILVFVVYSFRGNQPKAEGRPPVAAAQAQAQAQAAQEQPASPAAQSAPASAVHKFTDSLKQVLVHRAAVNLLDDFRGGLGAWQGSEGWAKTWRYGQATFLEPGTLAFYTPSMKLRDYSLEFLGQIQSHSLNWVFRAKDAKNYYAMRLIVSGSGPMPNAQIVEYAVINGKEERPKVMPTPYPVRPDTMYLVRVDVNGSDFNIYLQGQPLYSFTDDRLTEGGIGFFGPKGDKSFLRWVQVKHQYDYIGRLCALLAPYHVPPEAAKSE